MPFALILCVMERDCSHRELTLKKESLSQAMPGLLPPQIISPSFTFPPCFSLCAFVFPEAELSGFPQPSLPLKPLPTFPLIYTLPSCRNQMLPLYTHTLGLLEAFVIQCLSFLIQSGQWAIQCQTLGAFCGGGGDRGSGLTQE